MLMSLFLAIGIILVTIGVTDIIGMCASHMLAGNTSCNLIIVPINDNADDAELVIRSVAHRFRWGSWKKDSRVICVYNGSNEETEKICKATCMGYGFIEFLKSDEIKGVINNYEVRGLQKR